MSDDEGQQPETPIEQDESKEKDNLWKRTYNFSDEQLAELKEVFAMLDSTGTNVITAPSVGTALRAIGQNPTEAELQEMVREANLDDNGNLGIDEFMRLIGTRGLKTEAEMEEELEQALGVFDKNGEGCIDAAEFKVTLRTLGEPVDEDDIAEILRVAEVAGDGKINYYDFMKKLTQK